MSIEIHFVGAFSFEYELSSLQWLFNEKNVNFNLHNEIQNKYYIN